MTDPTQLAAAGIKRGHDEMVMSDGATLDVPRDKITLVVGPGGKTVNQLQSAHGVQISTPRRAEMHGDIATITFAGLAPNILACKMAILELIRKSGERQGGGGENSVEFPIPAEGIPLVIGKGGSVVQELQQVSGCNISIPREKERNSSGEVVCTLTGDHYSIEIAKLLISNALTGGTKASAMNLGAHKQKLTPDPSAGMMGMDMTGMMGMGMTGAAAAMGGADKSLGELQFQLAQAKQMQMELMTQLQGVNQMVTTLETQLSAQGVAPDANSMFMQQQATLMASQSFGMTGMMPSSTPQYGGTGAALKASNIPRGGSGEANLSLLVGVSSVRLLVGKGGTIIKQLEEQSRALISIPREDTGNQYRVITIRGDLAQMAEAARLISQRLAEGNETPGAPTVLQMLVPPNQVPWIVGKKGVIVQAIQQQTGVAIATPRAGDRDAHFANAAIVTLTAGGMGYDSIHAAVHMILQKLQSPESAQN